MNMFDCFPQKRKRIKHLLILRPSKDSRKYLINCLPISSISIRTISSVFGGKKEYTMEEYLNLEHLNWTNLFNHLIEKSLLYSAEN